MLLYSHLLVWLVQSKPACFTPDSRALLIGGSDYVVHWKFLDATQVFYFLNHRLGVFSHLLYDTELP